MKKTISILLALATLLALAMPVAAADSAVIDPTVTHSITEETATGRGLAFRFVIYAQGVQRNDNNEFVNTTATVIHEGKEVPLVRMGAVASNDGEVGPYADKMVLDNAQLHTQTVPVEGKYLNAVEADYCAFAVRIIHIPDAGQKTPIYVRPYYVVNVDGEEQIVYGDIVSRDHHHQWCINHIALPAIGTDIDITKQKNRIRVSDATRTGDEVTLTFRNYTTNWITEETDYVTYTCYDVDGKALQTDKIYIGCIDTKKNKIKSFTFTVPAHTAAVVLTDAKITYWTEWA